MQNINSIRYYINDAMIFSYYGMSLQNERSIVSPTLIIQLKLNLNTKRQRNQTT